MSSIIPPDRGHPKPITVHKLSLQIGRHKMRPEDAGWNVWGDPPPSRNTRPPPTHTLAKVPLLTGGTLQNEPTPIHRASDMLDLVVVMQFLPRLGNKLEYDNGPLYVFLFSYIQF